MASIYGLYDKDGALRYIGKANQPFSRLKSHMRDAKRRNTPLYAWIRKHGIPEMRVLEADCEDWAASEKRLIAEARANGDLLLNVADGGDQPSCSHETRVANGRNSKGRTAAFHSDPVKKMIWYNKGMIGRALNQGKLNERQINLMKQFPAVYGEMLAKAGYM